MLTEAGVIFSVQVADVDEDAVKAVHDPADAVGLALELAQAKALAVSRQDANAWVLGADQTLGFDGGLVSKAASLGEARARLAVLIFIPLVVRGMRARAGALERENRVTDNKTAAREIER